MSKSTLIAACVLALGAVSSGAVFADNAKSATEQATPAANPACVRTTGTRIPLRAHECASLGRSYTKAEVDRTGATTAAGALRLLGPGMTTR